MYALIVYESMYGNTGQVAQAVAEGLARAMRTEVVEVAAAPVSPPEEVALLVVGGPTHAFSMSRESTRRSAAEQAREPLVSQGPGIREWLAALRVARGTPVAAFDTRVAKPHLPGSAARAAAKRLRRLGLRLVAPAQSFFVTDSRGPLADGELDRARRWGETLAGHFAVPTS
ncbi:flavodoxin family protein [Nonomuraea cavernae]|uniref:Flavodoxin n=1 Tax=Nonomuraea cavernae TaxID=2045107 RepID=A0A917ZA82_9ACTN|nr:flavodoxin family protein [Nonomuraea cavernae]MCA2188837.1 flavodoxin-like domain-containing protein [Nonomuraea cavernae]GGO78394.1 flavodoxin [Nonomuraea cavernae]